MADSEKSKEQLIQELNDILTNETETIKFQTHLVKFTTGAVS